MSQCCSNCSIIDNVKNQNSCGCDQKHGHENNLSHVHKEHDHSDVNSKINIILFLISIGLFITTILLITSDLISVFLFAITIMLSSYELLIKGAKNLLKFKFDESTLMFIAIIAAFILKEYPEACIVSILFTTGEFLEKAAIKKSMKNMQKLTEIRPDTANIINENEEITTVEAKSVLIGDKIVIRAGDKVPLDCIVLTGESSIDSSAITGETLPTYASKGSTLYSGSININGLLTCEVIKDFKNSTASQIIELVYESSSKKGKTENLITKFAKIYTPIVSIFAVLLAIIPPLLGFFDFKTWIMRSLIFLVASCPCALVISVPLSFFSAIGANTKLGVLIKGSKYIEALSNIDCVAFDKTGTLTSGQLEVESIKLTSNISEKEFINLLANIESYSTHPISQSIINFAKDYEKIELENVNEYAGLGIQAYYHNDKILCGSSKYMLQNNIDISKFPEANIYLCVNNIVVGYVILSEQIPQNNLKVSYQLKQAGVNKTVMLTGDNKTSAQKIAKACNIDEFYSNLFPKDKVEQIEKLKASGFKCLFIGDGINDGPVLASADVGVSMGLGSEVANISSDIVLINNNLSSIPKAISLSKRSMKIIKFNIAFALIVKFIVLISGALGYANMGLAIFADVGVTIVSILNAVRIFTFVNNHVQSNGHVS